MSPIIEETDQVVDDEVYKAALDDWLEYWNNDGYQLATDTWASSETKNVDAHNRSDGHDTSHSSDDSLSNVQQEQAMIDLWREHYLLTYDRSLREYCSNHQLNYESFVNYISNTYSENEADLRTKTINRNDVRETNMMIFDLFSFVF